ncbi:MAG: HAD family phosphatase [Pseudomonadota bacterium]
MLADGLPAAVLFDMDGTLIDSERLARDCFEAACVEIGATPDLAIYNRCIGRTGAETRRIVQAGYGPDFPYDAMLAAWERRYYAHVKRRPVDIKPGVEGLLQRLATLAVPLAVVTSSSRDTTETKLELCGLAPYFALLVCGGEAPHSKPDPAPYQLACKRLNVAPQVCWALEDSDNGTRSAVAAGLRVWQIPDEVAPDAQTLALGHTVAPSADAVLDFVNKIA